MARKPSLRELKWMVSELLTIQAVAERYKQLEKDVKAAMQVLDHWEVEIEGKGRVFASKSERISISPATARSILNDLAEKIIEIKESVSNKRLEVLVDTGDITPEQAELLDEQAKKTSIVSLYVRPLK